MTCFAVTNLKPENVVADFKPRKADYSCLDIKRHTCQFTAAAMFSDYLKEVLLFRQGPFISEDATSIFELPGFARETDVQDWDVFLRFCLVPGDYIFKKRYRQDFLDSLETHLKMMYSMKPVFDSDEFNKKIFVRQELALRTVRNTLAEADFDLCHNPFALSW